jgi:trehalose 6-phosphate phosphatase
MELRSPEAGRRYDALVGAAARGVVCLDFDGVLAPIVEDPAQAHIHPDADAVLTALAASFRAIAVVTGRPARQAVELGRLDEVGAHVVRHGGDLLVRGQYGNERWSARTGEIESPEPPPGLPGFAAELPGLLRAEGLTDAFVEEKSLAVAVHTRRLPDPQGALDRLVPVLGRAAESHGLALEPGRMVLEVRAPGVTKGNAVRTLHDELQAEALLFAGDDLGDVEAFRAVAELREGGTVGLLVCSGSEEQQALVELADVVVPGPDGVMALLARLAEDAAAAAAGRLG